MKDIYIDRGEFERLFNPHHANQLQEVSLAQLSQFFNQPLNPHYYPSSNQYSNPYQTPIIVKILLTDKYHDGIWLVTEKNKDKVSIPGGHVSDEEWAYRTDPEDMIYRTLARELEEERVPGLPCGDDAINKPLNPYMDVANQLINYGFHIIGGDSKFYYSYYLPNNRGSFTIYILKEVDYPKDYIEPYTIYEHYQMVWYTRRDHTTNFYYRGSRKELFNSPYTDDIRLIDKGIDILNLIFQTDSIFGKMSIY
jgi:hypothetical protein